MHGKGNKYVAVLIQTASVKQLLIANRTSFVIADDNPFVLATKDRNGHASGWHAMASVHQR